jgi:hypothetical protein
MGWCVANAYGKGHRVARPEPCRLGALDGEEIAAPVDDGALDRRGPSRGTVARHPAHGPVATAGALQPHVAQLDRRRFVLGSRLRRHEGHQVDRGDRPRRDIAEVGPVHHHGPRTPRTDRQRHGDGGEHGARRVLEHERRITRRDPSLGVGVGAPARSPEIGSAANVGRIAFSHTSNRAMVSPTSTYLRVRERDRRSTSGAAIDGDDPTASC